MITLKDLRSLLLVALVALAVSLTVLGAPALPAGASPHGAIMRNGILCDSGESNCVEAWYGMNIRVYSDGGATQKFAVVGSSGNTSIAGTLNVTGGQTNSSTLAVTGNSTLSGVNRGAGEGTILYNTTVTTAVAALTGTVVVTVPADRQFRLVDASAIAVGGACASVTTVDLKSGSSKLVAWGQASLTQSTVLRAGASGATVLADGASFTPQPLGTDITLDKTGSTPTTCTNIIFNITYALE